MSDFDDDFDNFGDDNNFDDFNQSKSFKDVWDGSPLLKIFTILGGIVLVIAAFFIFSGGEDKQSRVGGGLDKKETLGGEISQNYADVLEEVNEQRLETAVKTGTSTIPLLVNPEEQELLSATEELPPYEEFDPLATFRATVSPEEVEEVIEEEPVLVEPEQIFSQPQQIPAPSPEAVQALAQAMSQSVSDILKHHTPEASSVTQVTPHNYFQILADEEAQRLADSGQMVDTNGDGVPDTLLSSGGDASAPVSDDVSVQNILIPAGTINYAQILTEANSDVPGPVLAQLVSGPLAGSRLIGSFSVAEESLVLNFDTIVVDGINQSIGAIAIDPNTTLPGVASEVDQRYWTRVILPAAARFLEGVGSAIAEDTETTVTVSGDTVIEEQDALDFEQELGRGVEEAFDEIADFMDEEADSVQPLIRVVRGTAVGIFFTDPVIEGGQ